MIDKTDILLYGGVGVAGFLVIFLGYRLFRKTGEEKPKNRVADSINDFYATQDNQHRNHDGQQSDSSDSASGDSSGD